ncbi:protein-L-isoaspartate(D-aspartate) O-methyltransferase [Pseudorhizobium tarimense]|uniref:Protein-L-isoaspartate O-methyltransferase n=1 Tax=Pseudorhizobium tarimense TaxID=1079109 RepID=A0ABV2H671_9HYPH|nr:methyltransferase domain-containing protein [Pseudorhizobium tarimense]MCJ8519140.1 methyltransferase domain-containing protein [Pseudorhizobium tarimense]
MTFEDQPIHRQLFASQVLAKAGVKGDGPLLSAFAKVERERFFGPPPWFYSDFSNYRELASGDPVVLYQDMLVALDRNRHVNNGVPSLHASALSQIGVGAGEHVAHIGAGTGYFTAILAELVGPTGRVTAVEYDPSLAQQARQNLSGYPQVEVIEGDGTQFPRMEVDVVYVNFALDHPASAWVANLAPRGRLLFPLGIPAIDGQGKQLPFTRMGGFLLIVREETGFSARFLQPVSFVWAEGQEPPPTGRHECLEAAFRSRTASEVKQLRWHQPPEPGEWYSEEEWGLLKRAL